MNFKNTEKGQAIILIVFSIIGLIGITALAVDGGNAYVEKRRAQNAADASALGGALARIKGYSWVQESYNIAESNGFDNNGETNAVQVFSPPATGEYAGDVEYIQVVITNHVSTYFGSVIGIGQVTVTGEAISRTKTPEIKEILDGSALISLAPTSDCNNEKSFWVHGSATLEISGGGIFINSNNPNCAFLQNGSGSIRIEDGEISVVGGASISQPQLLTPYPPKTNGIPISYPPPFFMPKVSCGKEATISEDGTTISSGSYGSEDFPPEGVEFMESGVYCLDGDFIMNGGSLEGGGVLILMDGGRIKWGGGSTINLSARQSGDLAGLLIYAPIENKNVMVIKSNAESSLKGTILMPGAEIHLNGSDSQSGYHSQIIGYRIESSGESNIVIKYMDEQNYDTYNMPEVQLTK
ncbi:MAG: pilus assembly protein TadG-related protein [Anaerolineales bacterium]|nr:pilus assembly protein TadG-related protein [Anaerolineales bacterium]